MPTAMSAYPSKLLRPPPAAPTAGAPASITGVIRKAAQATGASFDYLLAAAKVESNLNPNSSAQKSTATGLLSTPRQAGKALCCGRYSDAIGQAPSGRPIVPVVTEFWGVGAARAGAEEANTALAPALPAAAPVLPRPASSTIRPLDLFQDTGRRLRALPDGKV
jgi:hypothetical protein